MATVRCAHTASYNTPAQVVLSFLPALEEGFKFWSVLLWDLWGYTEVLDMLDESHPYLARLDIPSYM